MMYLSHKGAWSIDKDKWHKQPIIWSKLVLDSDFSFITFFYSNLIVYAFQVNFGKYEIYASH